MFLPVFTSHSVGGFFPSLTILRLGVCPHIVWSSADAGREVVARQSAAAATAARRAGWRGFMGSSFVGMGYSSPPYLGEGSVEGRVFRTIAVRRSTPHPALSPLSTRGRR